MIISGFSLVKGISSWEIHLVIQGIGEQAIINETFYKAPTRVNVKGTDEPSCSKTCNLSDSSNEVILYFEEEINSCENMFYGLRNIKEINFSNFDFSKVTNMHSMFRECKSLEKIDFGNINTSAVEDMSYLFEQCNALSSIDVSKFDTSSVTDMSRMFSTCNGFHFKSGRYV